MILSITELTGSFTRRPRHRLDARVAGPVACSKTRSAHVALGRAFEKNEVDKEYGALLVGEVASGTVVAPIDGLPSTTVVTAGSRTLCRNQPVS